MHILSLFRMIESVPNAVIVNESSVSFNAIVGLSGLMVYIVQYIIGRPANEQSFSSEQALCKLTAPPMIVNMRKIRIKILHSQFIECESNFLFYLIVIPFRCIARDEFAKESG